VNGITRFSGGWRSHIMHGGAFAVALVAGTIVLPAQSQTTAAKPACAAGDAVVWENTSTKAYHLAGDKYYGNTKHGAYACRSAADSAGYHLAGAKSGGSMSSAAKTNPSPAAMSDSPTPAPLASGSPAAAHHGKHHHRSSGAASPTPSPAAT
jgi:hypothetical protein